MWWLVAGALTVGVTIGSVALQRRTFILQYAFFSRYPLLAGAALVSLPGLGPIRNLFVVDPFGLGVITLLALVAAWTVMFTLALVFVSVPVRYRLPFVRGSGPLANSIPQWLARTGVVVFSVLAVPTIATAVVRSELEIGQWLPAVAVGAAAAGVVALVVRQAGVFRARRVAARSAAGAATTPRLDRAFKLSGLQEFRASITQGYEAGAAGLSHGSAALLLGCFGAAYVIGAFLLSPARSNWLALHTPALAYVLALLSLTCLVMTGISYFLDVYRVPVVAVLLLISWLSWSFFDTDHYYETFPASGRNGAGGQIGFGPIDAVRAWAETHPPETHPVMVVVAASGGGIKAAYWTAVVLSGLGADPEIGEQFARSIVLLSTVSGGSVGAMYFVDAYSPGEPPDRRDLGRIVDAAGASSLGATAWGVVYPDFWRSFLGVLVPGTRDRGWAMEQRWRQGLLRPTTTLSEWGEGVAAGWRPPVVMNGTLVESGARLLMSPFTRWPDQGMIGERAEKNIRALYPRRDLEIATAARLSATFPYVTPVSKAEGLEERERSFHVADGGYYDNFGIVTAVEFMAEVLPKYSAEFGRRRILLVEIRDSGPGKERLPGQRTGWTNDLVGPFLTMMNVRSAGQLSRNEVEVELLRTSWCDRKVEVERSVFELGTPVSLSWHLSETEKKQVRDDWKSEKNKAALEGVVGALRGRAPACL